MRASCTEGRCAPGACRHCSELQECGGAPEALFALADRALYTAKRAGRARVVGLVAVSSPGL
jgi:hypothetical protein